MDQLETAMNETEKVFRLINKTLVSQGGEPLSSLVQRNNLGGIISNVFSAQLGKVSPYQRQSDQKHPDLRNHQNGVGLEVKTANHPGKGGESHNGHSGWHLIACYDTDEKTGDITFVQIMAAELVGYEQGEVDWKLLASTHEKGRTGHIETYTTTPPGRAKLLDGTVYLDSERVDRRRWRRDASLLPIPKHSIFYKGQAG